MTKKLLVILLTVALMMVLCVFACAASEGYMVDSKGDPTNIKWMLDDENTLTFEIDPSSSNAASTELFNVDPVTGDKGAWNKALPTFAAAKTVIIGDGITAINGTFSKSTVKTVEIPTSLVKLGKNSFAQAGSLKTIYIRGNEPIEGVLDLSTVTSYENNIFLATKNYSTVIFNPAYTGDIPKELFKSSGISKIELPEGVKTVKNGAFTKTASLYTLTILGSDTEFESMDVFLECSVFPRIKAKAGSKAEAFAKENGFTFIDLDTGEVTAGTLELPTPKPEDAPFDPAGATAYGHIEGLYYNTYWAYYKETKTLKFTSGTSTKWNETGSFTRGITDDGWRAYIEEIEHIEIGPYIDKISQGAFENHTALKDVKLGNKISQIDRDAFAGCSSLTAVWRDDKELIEGRADLSKVKNVNNIFDGTGISEVLLSKNTTEITVGLSFGIKTLLTPNITDALKEYCKTNGYNLQNSENPDELYEYWFYIPADLPFCGVRAVWDFDESTGTLTIYGSGAVDDIVNYYGGGSKTAPWFSVKQKIKHVVITDRITAIGKYAFTQCKNLETVQIPDVDGFIILNAAFEKCVGLKSIYRAGTEPIEGTADLSKVHELESYVLENCYLIANVIINDKVVEIGESVFENNPNLANIYGTVGSYAQTWAEENGFSFFDVSEVTPVPIICAPPASTETSSGTVEEESVFDSEYITDIASDSADESESETYPTFIFEIGGTMDLSDSEQLEKLEAGAENNDFSVTSIIITAIVIAVAVVVILVITMRKKGK